MKTKKVGRIKVKITDGRITTKVWGAWSIKRAAICIAILTKHMAKEMERTPEYILQLATKALIEGWQSLDCDGNGGKDA